MKLVGGDSGRYEREQIVEDIVLAPSERAVVDVLFPSAGVLVLEHRTPLRTYRLAEITVAGEPAEPSLASEFAICTRWFCSVPGETWPNREFVHSGTSRGRADIVGIRLSEDAEVLLRRGDVIMGLDGHRITSATQLHELARHASERTTLAVRRDGTDLVLALRE